MKKLILLILMLSCIKNLKVADNLRNKGIDEDLAVAIINGRSDLVENLIKEGANVSFIYNNKSLLELALSLKEPNLNIIKILIKEGQVPDKENITKIYNLALNNFDFELMNTIKGYTLCHTSFDKQHVKEVEKFTEKNDIKLKNIKDSYGKDALIIAAADNDNKTINFLLENGYNINQIDSLGCTALAAASKNGHVEIVKILLNAGAKTTTGYLSYFGDPLLVACEKGHIEVVKILLQAGANVNVVDISSFDTALMKAIKNGHAEVVKILLNAGVSKYGEELIAASEKGHIEVIKILLETEIDVNYENKKGFTALTLAIKNGHIEVAKTLLRAGANINYKNGMGSEALTIAIKNRRTELIKILLNAGAIKRGALIDASGNGYAEAAKILLEAGANINEKNEDGFTALNLAIEKGHLEVIRILLEAGAGFDNEKEESYESLIMESIENGHLGILKILLEVGAGFSNKKGDSPKALMLAVKKGNLEAVRMLLGVVTNIDYKDLHFCTPLIKAVKKGHVEVVKALLQAGANIYSEDIFGKTIFTYVSEKFRDPVKSTFTFGSKEFKNCTKRKDKKNNFIEIMYAIINKISENYIRLYISLGKGAEIPRELKDEVRNRIQMLHSLRKLPMELFEKIIKDLP